MSWFRNLLTYVILVASTGVTLTAVVKSAYQGLPEKRARDESELISWLSANDVSQVSDHERRRLIARIEESQHGGFDWLVAIESLPDAARHRCLDNMFELLRMELFEKVATFHELPPRGRNRYAAKEVRKLLEWPALRGAIESGRRNSGTIGALYARAVMWLANEPPETLERFQAFFEAAKKGLSSEQLDRMGGAG